jgi:hypothetical protein
VTKVARAPGRAPRRADVAEWAGDGAMALRVVRGARERVLALHELRTRPPGARDYALWYQSSRNIAPASAQLDTRPLAAFPLWPVAGGTLYAPPSSKPADREHAQALARLLAGAPGAPAHARRALENAVVRPIVLAEVPASERVERLYVEDDVVQLQWALRLEGAERAPGALLTAGMKVDELRDNFETRAVGVRGDGPLNLWDFLGGGDPATHAAMRRRLAELVGASADALRAIGLRGYMAMQKRWGAPRENPVPVPRGTRQWVSKLELDGGDHVMVTVIWAPTRRFDEAKATVLDVVAGPKGMRVGVGRGTAYGADEYLARHGHPAVFKYDKERRTRLGDPVGDLSWAKPVIAPERARAMFYAAIKADARLLKHVALRDIVALEGEQRPPAKTRENPRPVRRRRRARRGG